MELVIGGAYQGKLSWAVRHYGFGECDLFDLASGTPEAPRPCLYHLEAYTKRAFLDGKSADEIVSEPALSAEDAVIISREISSGIVPMDRDERLWRELHGQVLRLLASKAVSVTRIFCGLAEELK